MNRNTLFAISCLFITYFHYILSGCLTLWPCAEVSTALILLPHSLGLLSVFSEMECSQQFWVVCQQLLGQHNLVMLPCSLEQKWISDIRIPGLHSFASLIPLSRCSYEEFRIKQSGELTVQQTECKVEIHYLYRGWKRRQPRICSGDVQGVIQGSTLFG